ncbi:hypothetical protein F8M41_013189 [Gigaspora margarita]|uniref:Uncharacterized protein n=1 Tax=Gigaspora margarita TaxID=4874 RepID=A0A8H4EP93_GIGMA|nr:hypothetical protein F8M41_013189 [Gigaspora margarita]
MLQTKSKYFTKSEFEIRVILVLPNMQIFEISDKIPARKLNCNGAPVFTNHQSPTSIGETGETGDTDKTGNIGETSNTGETSDTGDTGNTTICV